MKRVAILAVLLLVTPATPQDNKSETTDDGVNITRGFLSTLSSFFGKPRTCNCYCGKSNRGSIFRLLNGEYSMPHEFPWLVAIIVNGSQIYGGALINDRYVLVAASNVGSLSPYDVKVTLGANNRCVTDLSSVNESVSSIIVNPNYDPRTGVHDFALIKLSNPITFNQKINPICLPELNAKYLGQVVTVVNWGEQPVAENVTTTTPAGRRKRNVHDVNRTSRQANVTGYDVCMPKKLGLPVLGEGSCPYAQDVMSDMGCAGIAGSVNLVCESDAGSPVQFRDYRGVYQLVGVVSGRNYCGVTMPSLYTRINEYVPWINRQTLDACYCLNTLGFFPKH